VVKYLLAGGFLGLAGVVLSYLGNPPNTGVCVSCFMENIAGSLGLHENARMQYIRPEIPGFVLGSFIVSYFAGQFRASAGSSTLLRFFVGILLIVGCSVFIGCPIKMLLRISAGDLTALVGLAGLSAGVYVGMKFVEGGFSLGEPQAMPLANGFIMPALMVFLLALRFLEPGFVSVSEKGAGALRAPAYISLGAGLLAGALAQRSGFCITGGLARLFLWGPKEVKGCPKSTGLLMGIASFLSLAFVTSILTGQFLLGWHGQPSSNMSYGWSFLGMMMVGFGSVLIKGCPFRQLVLAGQGDGDAGAAVLGMLTGAALVQTWGLGGDAAGTPYEGKVAVLVGICALLIAGIAYRNRQGGISPEFQRSLD